MGKVVAVRGGGPAEKAGVLAWSEEAKAPRRPHQDGEAPRAGGKQTWFAAGDVKDSQARTHGSPARPGAAAARTEEVGVASPARPDRTVGS